ncbi:hypothetical protein AAGS61_17220 [Lysinibacillus sp. KU-BSD001]|uniref:hypothetical protein n=1 Tax=Lysinibacillus sp. KU-BSD001 TaxID=3141328 RepID=UPI0036E0BCCD
MHDEKEKKGWKKSEKKRDGEKLEEKQDWFIRTRKKKEKGRGKEREKQDFIMNDNNVLAEKN